MKMQKTTMARRFKRAFTLWTSFAVAMLVSRGAQATVTLGFSSPVTNSAPGAAYTANYTYTPTTNTFEYSIVSGSGILNSHSGSALSGTGSVSLTPQPNASGNVRVRVYDTNNASNDKTFDVWFRQYPPVVIAPASVTVDEDSTNSVNFTVSYPDRAVNNSLLSFTVLSDKTALVDSIPVSSVSTGNFKLTITPKRDQNGTANLKLITRDANYSVTNSIVLYVTPKPDAPSLSGVSDITVNDNVGSASLLPGVLVDDVDHNMPAPEYLSGTVTLANDVYATLADGASFIVINNKTPGQLQADLRAVSVFPRRYTATPGTIQQVPFNVKVQDGVFTVVSNATLSVEVTNTEPDFLVQINPTMVYEGQTIFPFALDYIDDPDYNDDIFALRMEFKDPAQASLATFSTNALPANNRALLGAALESVAFHAVEGALSTSQETVELRFILSDGFGGVSTNDVPITIYPASNPPTITGIPDTTINCNDGAEPFVILPDVVVQDSDLNGLQPVSAVITLSNPLLGSLSLTNLPLQLPSSLTVALRSITFEPFADVLPINTSADTVVTVKVTDDSGVTTQNSNLKINVQSVNNAPRFQNIPPVTAQPVIFPPVDPLYPFAAVGLTNDDTNDVTVIIECDDAGKGAFGNLGSFTVVNASTVQMQGSIPAILGSLTNITFSLDPGYQFPENDPGGTTFTLSAQDVALLTSSRTLYIQVQHDPRNHIVTRALNDGLPGSFNYALQNISNYDYITFALPEYPALIRMQGVAPDIITRNVTIKGPGANLLTISGDGDGDEIPDRQLFQINANVTIDGVTLARGRAETGGAISVEETGNLVLRNAAVVDSVATSYGGAIDVFGGTLTVVNSFIGRNTLDSETGLGGAGISTYTDNDLVFINTTFSANVQPSQDGDGGAALLLQRASPGFNSSARIEHCTFAENSDASGRASAVLAIGPGIEVLPLNNIFGDADSRNLNVISLAEYKSQGGNICDDSSRATLLLGGGEDVYLLDHETDLVSTDPLLGPLDGGTDPLPLHPPLAGSPAIGHAIASTVAIDQRGAVRDATPDSGAVESGDTHRIVINEIQNSAGEINFIELYVLRDSVPVDLTGYKLYIDETPVHEFSNGFIVGTNAVFSAGEPVAPVIEPGFGMVVAFTNAPVALTPSFNLTPVAGASLGYPAPLPGRGTVMVAKGAGLSGDPQLIAVQTWLSVYLDPASGTNFLDTTGQSISLAPQFRGVALLPHGGIQPGPFGGFGLPASGSASSPGGDSSGTGFGQENSVPLAFADTLTVPADRISNLDVVANDYDGDGNDRVVIVDVSTESDPGVGDAGVTNSALGAQVSIIPSAVPLRGSAVAYNPAGALDLRSLPAGVEIVDSFYYEALDIGSALISAFSNGGTNTIISSTHHRLVSNALVKISGASRGVYNDTFAVEVLDADHFAIPVTYVGPSTTPSRWESVDPRSPTARSEAKVSVRVMGVNDIPVVGADVITNISERGSTRIMALPDRAGTVLSFIGDPVPAPVMSAQNLLENDDDIDTDDTWRDLRVVGVMNAVQPIADYASAGSGDAVAVESPAHGLETGTTVLIANYGGVVAYNGYHAVTVVDADHFTIPVSYVDNAAAKGVWVVLTEENRYAATTDVGAVVTLVPRSNADEDHLLYNASASEYLQGLAEGELYTNRFWYAVADSHGAIGIGPVDAVVVGVNNEPVAHDDPLNPGVIDPLLDGTNTVAEVLADILEPVHLIRGEDGSIDLYALDRTGQIPGLLQFSGQAPYFITSQDQALAIAAAHILANDTDIDRLDILAIDSADAQSHLGADVSVDLAGGIVYNPTNAAPLTALARGEMRLDSFRVTISDGNGGTAESLVIVLVVGVNQPPVATADTRVTHEDEATSLDVLDNDFDLDIDGVEPDDLLRLITQADVPNAGGARVDITSSNITHDATVSVLLNRLADWQVFTNTVTYTISDGSHLFAVNDSFHVLKDSAASILDVLANDHDAAEPASELRITAVDAVYAGGTVAIVEDGRAVSYTPPSGFAGLDAFRYTIENERGNRRSATVRVHVKPAMMDGLLTLSDDHYSVAYGETISMDVLANDPQVPQSGGLALARLVSTDQPGQPIQQGNSFLYTATNGVNALHFSYEAADAAGNRGVANVTLSIVDRRGQLDVSGDHFSVLPDSFENELFVLDNDGLLGDSLPALTITGITVPPQHGALSVREDGKALVYTPSAGYLGVEQVVYAVKDGLGATGTGTVSIAVGRVRTVPHFYKLLGTDANTVALDVLADDRTQPAQRGTLLITAATFSAGDAGIGSLVVNSAGDGLEFTAAGPLGQGVWNYTVEDASTVAPRSATGTVTIVTVGNGTYANPETYRVRANGSDYLFDVLANDRGYPSAGRIYSILSIGTGGNAPSAGGTATISAGKIKYTPAADYVGQEYFTYTMSDAYGTDVAQVTVDVLPGDLIANADEFSLFYEWEDGQPEPRTFTLPVTLNDRLQPAFDKTFAITGIGVGSDAPDHGATVQIASGALELLYTPATNAVAPYDERFTYEIGDDAGRRAAASVTVRVARRSAALDAITQGDVFSVARNSANNQLDVLANDNVRPAVSAGWRIGSVSGSSLHGGAVSISGRFARYTPPADFVGLDSFTYAVNDSLGGTGNATVTVRVGNLPTQPDAFMVLGDGATNRLDVLVNDALTLAYANAYALSAVGAPDMGGTAWQSPDNAILYTADPAYAGGYPYVERFSYSLRDSAGGTVSEQVVVKVYDPLGDRATTTATFVVEGRNDPPEIHNATTNAPITDKDDAVVFTDVTFVEHDEQLQERIDVEVQIDDPDKGALVDLGLFADLGGGRYALSNATAAVATTAIRQLRYIPVENRITVPTTERVTFVITVTDNKSPPVTDSLTTLDVTAVNDEPTLVGTRADQLFYYLSPYAPFQGVLITEVDDLTLQPLKVTVTLAEPAQGTMQNLGAFAALGGGVYQATNVTAAAATGMLRAMEFVAAAVKPGAAGTVTHIQLEVDDGFAAPIVDNGTSVVAMDGYNAEVTAPAALNGNLGLAVDAIADFAIAGAPNATTNGANSGAAFIYRLTPGTTNQWVQWQTLHPATVGAGAHFGRGVSMDTVTAAVGAPDQAVGGIGRGAVYIYRRDLGDPDRWDEWLSITPTNVANAAQFGLSVSLRGDLLAVGAPKATLTGGQANSGAVFLFGRHVGGPNQWGEIMRYAPTNAAASNANFGWSVTVSGSTLIVGAPDYDANTGVAGREGAIFHFHRDAGGADQWGLAQTVGGEVSQSGAFGWAVAVDDTRLAVGAYKVTVSGVADAGRVYIYGREQPADAFGYLSNLNRAGDQERNFGYSLAFDGGNLLVGAPNNLVVPNIGAAYLFARPVVSNAVWTLTQKLTRPSGSTAELLGRAVGFHQGTAIVGAPASSQGGSPSARGYAYIYRFDYEPLDDTYDPTPRQIWNQQHFGDVYGDAGNAIMDGGSDPDGDGVPNDAEYAFGGDPNVGDTPGVIQIAQDANGDWVITYDRRSDDDTLLFTLQVSEDLVQWVDVMPLDENAVPISEELEHVVTTYSDHPLYRGQLFFRIKVNL